MRKYNILIVSVLAIGNLWGQQKPKTDWFFEKPCKKNMGISVNEAYQSAEGKLPSTTIVVAVIDGGTDVNHVDLKDVIWVNKGEIPSNGIDDDNNGYVDDVNGWNFIGGKDGSLVVSVLKMYFLRNDCKGRHLTTSIAATRNNNIGMNGIADNVKIMVVRVVPDGDERDKDVANGIRYAVDNGAKIINMSFGKAYRWDKNIVIPIITLR